VSLLILLALLVALGLAARWWGHDCRGGRDWRSSRAPASQPAQPPHGERG
jgi:hypothetical protein